jgi:endonuclease/exonuclease/phosphatase family metal-dependent hydrolase
LIELLSWNVRKAVGLDWRRDPSRVVGVLRAQGPDVALLQEVDKRLGARPSALPEELLRAAGYRPVDADPDTPSLGWHGNTILLRPHLHLREMHRLALPGLEPRGAVLARIEGAGGGLTVVCAHLGLRRRDRRAQMAALFERLAGEQGPQVVGGDLNEWALDPKLLAVPAGWHMSVPGPSYHAAFPRAPLDRFLHGPGVRLDRPRVVPPRQARRASDHLPVRATLRWAA